MHNRVTLLECLKQLHGVEWQNFVKDIRPSRNPAQEIMSPSKKDEPEVKLPGSLRS